ncbi:MAG: radical SAM family heme chaperone HemW, partial [Thermodesulfobacteriota bacterium]
ADSLGKIIHKIKKLTNSSYPIEVTLEVNPRTADFEQLNHFRDVGVNRISVGVQSLSDWKLKVLGRENSPYDTYRLFENIIKAGFLNYSSDLMYGCSYESLKEWKSDLEIALEFHTTHISAYCLTIEEDTAFGSMFAKGELPLPSEETLSDMFMLTSELLDCAGYYQYEISNFAKNGFECKHNLLYWRGDNYLGVGAGAHSHIQPSEYSVWGKRWANIKSPSLYMEKLFRGLKPIVFQEFIDRETAIKEKVLMGLRLREGVSLSLLTERFGVNLITNNVHNLVDDGYLDIFNDSLRVNKNSLLISNEIIYKVLDSVVC